MNHIAALLENAGDLIWIYIGVPVIVIFGLYLSIKARFVQVRRLPKVFRYFGHLIRAEHDDEAGIHPLKAFFASVGGCIGIGNIVVVCTAVQFGGPGALLWLWLTALVGMLLKYAEVYLGVKFRVGNSKGGWDGGPAYYLKRVFNHGFVPALVAMLLCVYGVEILQFNIVATSLTVNFGWSRPLVVVALLAAVLWVGGGGVRRVGDFCSAIIPFFTLCFVGMGMWVLMRNITVIPEVLGLVVKSAFTGHAAVGGFAGAGLLMTISHGVRWGCYSGDIGIGYAAVLHAETSSECPEHQAALTLFEIVLDTFVICSTSILIILVTGVWKEPIHVELLVQNALAQYFPYMNIFMPLFLLLLGFSTIVSYFCFGLKASDYLSPKWGRRVFYAYAIFTLALFSFVDTAYPRAVMSITGAMLLLINVLGIIHLRKEVNFKIDKL